MSTLIEDVSFEGEWWKPHNPDDRIGGKVTFSDGRIVLRLNRSFVSSKSPLEGQDKPTIVLGMSRYTPLCLIEVREHNPNGPGPAYIEARYLLVNKHFTEMDLTLTSLSAHVTHLENWMDTYPFSIDYEGGLSGEGVLEYVPPDFAEFEVESPRCCLKIGSSINFGSPDFKTVTWKHAAVVNISSDFPMAIDWYLQILTSLTRLLSLCMGTPMQPLALRGHVTDEGIQRSDGRIQSHVSLYVTGYIDASEANRELPFIFRPLVPYPSIKATLDNLLNKWFAEEQEMKPVHNLYLSTQGVVKVFVEFEFIALTQALEAFHRRTMPPGEYLSKTEWEPYKKQLVDCIPAAIDSDHRESLKSRLRYGYQYSLRKRFNELIKSIDEDLADLVTEDKPEFINKVVELRNDLTHYDIDEIKTSVEEIFDLTSRLRCLLAALLWKRLGIEAEIIQEGLMRLRNNLHSF